MLKVHECELIWLIRKRCQILVTYVVREHMANVASVWPLLAILLICQGDTVKTGCNIAETNDSFVFSEILNAR